MADHPRSRGVYPTSSGPAPTSRGSSPLARGLQATTDAWPEITGIIPARAGFTATCGRRMAVCSDHPRSRGVYTRCAGRSWPGRGSSPLARGLPLARLRQYVSYGIIPARAGFTQRIWTLSSASGDHPRSRGVYVALSADSRRPSGSSPLARGLHVDMVRVHEPVRIIPARAGFTFIPISPACPIADHPRSRGVYVRVPSPSEKRSGSSPLARGLRLPNGGRPQ